MGRFKYILIFLMLFCFSIEGKSEVVAKDSVCMAPKPIRVFYDWNVVCVGEKVHLSLDYSNAGSILVPQIQWSTNEMTSSIVVTPKDSMEIWVRLYDNAVLVATDTVKIYATTPPQIEKINDTICKGNDARIGVIGGAFYAWNTDGTTPYINVRPLRDTFYRVQVSNYPILENGYSNHCYTEDSVWVIVNQSARFEIIADSFFCPNRSVMLRIEEASNILWSTGDTGTMTYITIKEDTVRTSVIATDRFGCREKKTHTAIVSLPQGSIVSSVDTLCFGDELILTVLSSMAESVRWYNGSTDSELHLRPKNTLICYVDLLMADSVGGCANRIYDTIYVKECSNVMMPNAFKLGGFSKEIKPIGIYEPYKNYYFAIYTRNGKLIFESRDFNVGWDGTYKGNWVQPAVYVYYYRESVGNRKLEERGTITVVR